MWLTVTCGVAVCWAGLYLGVFNGASRGDVFNGLATSAGLLWPTAGTSRSGGRHPEPTLAEEGKVVYAPPARPLPLQNQEPASPAPLPLVKSSFVNGSEEAHGHARSPSKGLIGDRVTVSGAIYNSQMQAWGRDV